MPASDAPTTRVIVRILATVTVFAGLLYVLVLIRGTLLLLGIAIFLAVALGPAVDAVQRGRLPRAAAILLVYVLIATVLGGVLAVVVPPVVDGASGLSRDIPGYIEQLRDNPTIRDFDDRYDLTGTLQAEAQKLPSRLGDAAGALQSVAVGVFNAAFQLITVLTMTFFLLLDGGRIVGFLLGLRGRADQPRLREVTRRIYRSTAGYVAGALTISAINATITLVTLTILGVPFAVPLAVMMGFFGLIPLVGATIGGVIILLVTLFTDFPTATIVYAIVLLLYQQLENNVLQPFVYRRTVNVPPLAVIVGILAGSSLLGVAGALVAIPIVAALQILLREYYFGRVAPGAPPEGSSDAPRTTAGGAVVLPSPEGPARPSPGPAA